MYLLANMSNKSVSPSGEWIFTYVLAFVGFLLLRMDGIFMLSRFFPNDSRGTLYLPLGLVGMQSVTVFLWAVMIFLYSSFGVIVSDICWRVSIFFSYRIFIANISIDKFGPVVMCGFDCFLFLHRLRRIFALTILWLVDIPSKEEYASQFRVRFIYLLMSI